MKKLVISLFLLCSVVAVVCGQKTEKPWVEWSDKDVKKILDSSGWGQVQVETDTSQMMFGQSKGANVGTTGTLGSGSSEGNISSPGSVNYHIRFLSAKPIRQAIVRQIMLTQKMQSPTDPLKNFAEGPSGDIVVVAVYVDSGDKRATGPTLQAFGSATIGTLKNTTFLERKDGKRLFVEAYQPPNSQGFGAQFRFPRSVDGKPFITADTGTVRFYAEIPYSSAAAPNLGAQGQSTVQPGASASNGIKLDMRFKVADMMFGGKLEY